MLKLVKYLLWLVILAVLAVGFDQFMVRVPVNTPGLKQTQQFYVDFRTRLIGLLAEQSTPAQPVDVIEAVITKKTAPVVKATKKAGQRYLYVDDGGILQFADSLQQVPEKHRQDAQPLAE